jgi:ketosteroid isomerase-like protein
MRPAYLVPAVLLLLSSPVVAQSATNTASALKRIEQRYAKATVERDTLVLRRLESPDAVIQYPDGTVGTGASDVNAVVSGMAQIEAYDQDSVRVHLVNPTVAVVVYRASVKGNMRATAGTQAQDISGNYRFMDVWRKRGGQWQLVAQQITGIAAK